MNRVTPVAIAITTGDPRPIARQIVDAIRRQISTGELSVGGKLPSVRGLAQQLGINPNTVSKAYAQLTGEGWLEAHAGLGLFVAVRRDQLSSAERERRLGEAVDRFVGEVIAIRCPADEAVAAVADALDALSFAKSA
ncbi:GntR family transcriptional regulator [Sphingomonas sp. G-3-2-10]|uniref:GntR family transcriptional regulator n=1 Tax=Sphingomonas sp. G-3-2-10 TaxID=2728838 RepID=UPI00146B2F7B|nr:GntR family transcriptional regulator [Sphingomonas sp. G-3-2-10]NML04301.1 GntR family transcriptional regulator [Sphingomonas sp. G-3-2-10]